MMVFAGSQQRAAHPERELSDVTMRPWPKADGRGPKRCVLDQAPALMAFI